MIRIEIPDSQILKIEHLVLDFNGTLAIDGCLIDGITDVLDLLSNQVVCHILTADTYNTVFSQIKKHRYQVVVIPPSGQDQFKAEYVRKLGSNNVALYIT
jgi:soluble P-type ATPase